MEEQTIEIIIRCTRCNLENFHAGGYTYFAQDMSDFEDVRCPACDKPTQWVLVARIPQSENKRDAPESLIEEDYTTWSNEKFCRLIARWREDAHMAGNHDAYLLYKQMLEPAEAAFKQLHPRAYQNFEKRFHEQFS